MPSHALPAPIPAPLPPPRLHVALVSETYPPEVNGVALTVQGFEDGLRALGHRVSVVRPRQAGAAARPGHLLLPGVALPGYPGLRLGLPATRRITACWRERRPDVVYVATEGPLGWSALRAARGLGIPAVTGFHTRFDDYLQRYGHGWLAPMAMRWLRYVHNSGSATLVPTRELQAFLENRGFERVERVPRAVDCGRFDPALRSESLRLQWGIEGEAPAVIHVGRIAAEKNLSLAIEAFRAIQASQPGARFVLVGDGPLRAALQAAHPDFVFTGVQRGTALAAHFASADLFLFPSCSETFGNVTLEAMASGVPTVAFDYGAAREHLVDGVHGLTLESGDDAGFVDAACTLACQPALRMRMGAAARQAATALDPARAVAELAERLSLLVPRCDG